MLYLLYLPDGSSLIPGGRYSPGGGALHMKGVGMLVGKIELNP